MEGKEVGGEGRGRGRRRRKEEKEGGEWICVGVGIHSLFSAVHTVYLIQGSVAVPLPTPTRKFWRRVVWSSWRTSI
jgi:hypothetical protein